MRHRIFGLEQEYGVAGAPADLQPSLADRLIRPLARKFRTTSLDLSTFLDNGGRAYVDTGQHPEYATPECGSAYEALVWSLAGDRILEAERRRVVDAWDDPKPPRIRLLKNNLDAHGTTYGCHENYLVPRSVHMPFATAMLVPFLVSRPIFAGAGTVLVPHASVDGTRAPATFAICQRAAVTETVVATCTTQQRPIMNSRDEPHAESRRYRRLHLICGDANRNEVATFLKLAVTSLVLEVIEAASVLTHDEDSLAAWWPPVRMSRSWPVQVIELADPVAAFRTFSTDLTCRTTVPLADGSRASALDLQWAYVEMVDRHLAANGAGREAREAFAMWVEVLGLLEADPMLAHKEVDWVTKYRLLDRSCARGGYGLDDARAQQLDLLYHDIADDGVFGRLSAGGHVRRLSTDAEVDRAMTAAPASTRANVRSAIVAQARAAGCNVSVDWTLCKVTIPGAETCTLSLSDPFLSVDRSAMARLEAFLQSHGRAAVSA